MTVLILEKVARSVLAPFKVIRRTLSGRFARSLAFQKADRLRPSKKFSLPVLEYGQLSSLYFAIEQAVKDDEGYEHSEGVYEVWLRCLVAGQYFSDRLLMDIRAVERNIAFWKGRLETGNNALFLAVARGPKIFFEAFRHLILHLRGKEPAMRLRSTYRIEQRIVTLRTMHNALTAMLMRVHDAARRMAISPAFKDDECAGCESVGLPLETARSERSSVGSAAAKSGQEGPKEIEEGSTARAVAAAAGLFSKELLDMVKALQKLQQQLDQQEEGQVSLQVSPQPVLFALNSSFVTPLPEDVSLSSVSHIPETVLLASQRLHDFQGALGATHVRLSWKGHPVSGLKHASAAADEEDERMLLRMPAFAQAPSQLQQHWLRYALNGSVLMFVTRFLVINSPLVGSDNLRKWTISGYTAVLRALRDNVVRPLTNVRDEFFETFSSRASYSKSGKADFEASKASLERMLEQFEADIALKDKGFVDGKKATSRMDLLLRHYERELRHPLRNAVTGHLPRALLVQVHKMKTDLEAAMVELDHIMRANELTVAVTAALPSMLVAILLGWGLLRLLMPPAPNMRTAAGPVRVAMAELEQSIDAAMAAEEKVRKLEGDDEGATSMLHAARCTVQQQRGQVLVNVAKLRSIASALYAMSSRSIAGAGDGSSWAQEWKHLEDDLLAVATATTAARQAHIAGRAHRTYLVFRT